MTLTFPQCDLNAALGLLRDSSGRPVVIPTGGADVASVQAVGTFTTAVVTVKQTNVLADGAYANFDTPQELRGTSDELKLSDLLAIRTEYIVCELTTVEGGAAAADIVVHLRPSNIGQAVVT